MPFSDHKLPSFIQRPLKIAEKNCIYKHLLNLCNSWPLADLLNNCCSRLALRFINTLWRFINLSTFINALWKIINLSTFINAGHIEDVLQRMFLPATCDGHCNLSTGKNIVRTEIICVKEEIYCAYDLIFFINICYIYICYIYVYVCVLHFLLGNRYCNAAAGLFFHFCLSVC